MKKTYTNAELEIIIVLEPDIITTSGDEWLGDDGKPNHDPSGWT